VSGIQLITLCSQGWIRSKRKQCLWIQQKSYEHKSHKHQKER